MSGFVQRCKSEYIDGGISEISGRTLLGNIFILEHHHGSDDYYIFRLKRNPVIRLIKPAKKYEEFTYRFELDKDHKVSVAELQRTYPTGAYRYLGNEFINCNWEYITDSKAKRKWMKNMERVVTSRKIKNEFNI
ncbi:MAG: hypothetical protein V3U72_04665 [Candidatus Aenigmarchaeota archaeon]